MASITATIYYENNLWVGTFERSDREGYAVARHIFGAEPSDPEVYQFVLEHYRELSFGTSHELQVTIRRMNPKRLQRQIRREMDRFKATSRPSTLAQQYMRLEVEKNKKEKQRLTSAAKQARHDFQFALRQQKKKDKQRGH